MVTGADSYAFRSVQTMLAATAYEAIRAYVFAVIPLFMLMGEFHRQVRHGHRCLSRHQPPAAPITRPAGDRHGSRQRAVLLRDRGQHRLGRGALAHRLSRDEAVRLPPRVRAGRRRRVELPRHADPAQRADDRLGHPHRAIDRPDFRRRHPARAPPDVDVRGLCLRDGAPETGARRRRIEGRRRGRPGCRGGCRRSVYAPVPGQPVRHRRGDRRGAGRYLVRRLHPDRRRRRGRLHRPRPGDRQGHAPPRFRRFHPLRRAHLGADPLVADHRRALFANARHDRDDQRHRGRVPRIGHGALDDPGR